MTRTRPARTDERCPADARWSGVLALLLLAGAEPGAAETVGVNEGPATYYHPGVRLVNFAHRGDRWVSRTAGDRRWSDGRTIEVDPLGYPRQLEPDQIAALPLTTHNGKNYPVGVYVLTWSGDADVVLNHRSAEEMAHAPRRVVYRIGAASQTGLQIEVRRVGSGAPLRDLRLIAADEPRAGGFHRSFVEELSRFDVIRLMDIGSTNSSEQRDWRDRPTLDHLLWSQTGWPWETQIELANRTATPIWICVPHRATDGYVTRLAELFAAELDPSLAVWVEYSNEIWNTAPAFKQTDWVAENLADAAAPSAPGAGGRRAAEIWKTFERALGDDRVVNVVAGQAGSSDPLRKALKGAALVDGVDPEVASYSAYFHVPEDELYRLYRDRPEDFDAAFRLIDTSIRGRDVRCWKANAKLCREYGLTVVAYEGGAHIACKPGRFKDDGWIEYLAALHRHPRMRQAYATMRREYRAAGGEGIVYFNRLSKWSKWGSWGHREAAGMIAAPRWLAIEDHLRETRRTAVGGGLP